MINDLIIRPKKSGKTTELLKKSAETHTYILVKNQKKARQLFNQARQMGYAIPYPVTLDEYRDSKFVGSCIRRDGIYIDDLDELLKDLLPGIRIKAATLTCKDEDDGDYVDNE